MCEHCNDTKRDELRPQVVAAFSAYVDALLREDTEQRIALRAKYVELKKEYEACAAA